MGWWRGSYPPFRKGGLGGIFLKGEGDADEDTILKVPLAERPTGSQFSPKLQFRFWKRAATHQYDGFPGPVGYFPTSSPGIEPPGTCIPGTAHPPAPVK